MLKKLEMLEILRTLEFDSEAMAKLLAIIEGVEGDTLDTETLREIKAILLEEEEKALDDAAAEMGVDVSTDPAVVAAKSEYTKEVDEIRSEFEDGMRDIDEAMDKLEFADGELTRVTESIQITQITETIKAS